MTKGIFPIPGRSQLSDAYELLLHGSPTVSELALFSQWARIDPRLAEIWTGFVSRNWTNYNPSEFNDFLSKQPWPTAAGVLLDFATTISGNPLIRNWIAIAIGAVNCVANTQWEQFFIGHRPIGGISMFEDCRFSSEEYRRWGYFGRESLCGKEHQNKVSRETREEIIKSLLEKRPRFTIQDYWHAIGKSVSVRQAERQLAGVSWLKGVGRTKARHFKKK